MGRSVVKAALAHGDLVTGVGRRGVDTFGGMGMGERGEGDVHRDGHGDGHGNGSSPYLGLLCDVRVRDTVKTVFERSIEHWGRMDIIANCSGYGVMGACEDQDEMEIRNQFETNFWGVLNILQESLGYFRGRGRGGEGEGKDGEEVGMGVGGRYLIFRWVFLGFGDVSWMAF